MAINLCHVGWAPKARKSRQPLLLAAFEALGNLEQRDVRCHLAAIPAFGKLKADLLVVGKAGQTGAFDS